MSRAAWPPSTADSKGISLSPLSLCEDKTVTAVSPAQPVPEVVSWTGRPARVTRRCRWSSLKTRRVRWARPVREAAACAGPPLVRAASSCGREGLDDVIDGSHVEGPGDEDVLHQLDPVAPSPVLPAQARAFQRTLCSLSTPPIRNFHFWDRLYCELEL